MMVEQSRQYFTKYNFIKPKTSKEKNTFYDNQINKSNGLASKSNIHSEKDDTPILAGNLTKEFGVKGNENVESSPFSHFTRLGNNIITQLGVETKTAGNEFSIENDDDIETILTTNGKVHDAKREAMKGLLKEMGIKGEITTSEMQTVPSNYTTYYVKTESNAKNLFILELENGEILFTETEREGSDQKSSNAMIGAYHSLFGNYSKGELSVDELKKLYAKSFGVGELKDFILEFSEYKR